MTYFNRKDYEEYITEVTSYWHALSELDEDERVEFIRDTAEELELDETTVEDALYLYTELMNEDSIVRRRLISLVVFLDNVVEKESDEDGDILII